MTPDGQSEQLESEKPDDDALEPSAGSSSHVGNSVPLNNNQTIHSATTFDIDKHVRLALQSQSVAVPKQLWESGIWQSIFSDASMADPVNLFGQELRRPSTFPGPIADGGAVETSKKKARVQRGFDQVVRMQSSIKLWYLLIGRWKKECAYM